MLVITRKEGEVIQIGPDIWIRISRIRGKSVRVAIDAPLEMRIYRDDHDEYIPPHDQEGYSDENP